MMNPIRGVILSVLMLAAAQVSAACQWPAWEQFKKEYVSTEGRVVDPADSRKITTSEGQSYALFFALAANDRDAFGKLFQWTQNNLAAGDLRAHLPAGCGAKRAMRSGRCWTATPRPTPIYG
ncbi:endoglucanase [Raoultella ornithinolytica]|nr:endoglucanase [Raoultella ornithinolytica]